MIAEFTAGEWVFIIANITTAIVTIINTFKINAVHKIANSLSDKRNDATQKAAYGEGVLAEKADQQLRADIRGGVPMPAAMPQEVKVVNPPSQPVPTTVDDKGVK